MIINFYTYQIFSKCQLAGAQVFPFFPITAITLSNLFILFILNQSVIFNQKYCSTHIYYHNLIKLLSWIAYKLVCELIIGFVAYSFSKFYKISENSKVLKKINLYFNVYYDYLITFITYPLLYIIFISIC